MAAMDDNCHINRLLSIDLMREVFSYLTLLDNLLWTYPFHMPRATRAPLLLTFICSHWRNIALRTPGLWSTLVVDIEQILPGGKKRDLYQLWLNRSWGTPVALEIVDIRRSKAHLLESQDWINFLLTHIPYWKFLSTGPIVGKALLHGLCTKPRGSARHLEGIRLTFGPTDRLEETIPLSAIFPNLSQADITAASCTGFGNLQVNSLTHLFCNLPLFDVLFKSGSRKALEFPKLMELHIYHYLQAGEAATSQYAGSHSYLNAIHTPELRYLKIFDRGQDLIVVRDILHLCLSPRLEILVIENHYGTADVPRSVVTSGDFAFFITFLQKTGNLRCIMTARMNAFLTTAFLKHPQIRSNVDLVQVAIPTSSARFRTVHDAQGLFDDMWKAEGLDVVFSTGAENTTYTTAVAYIGWSRLPTQPLGTPLCKQWRSAFWDQEAYVDSVRKIRAARLVAC